MCEGQRWHVKGTDNADDVWRCGSAECPIHGTSLFLLFLSHFEFYCFLWMILGFEVFCIFLVSSRAFWMTYFNILASTLTSIHIHFKSSSQNNVITSNQLYMQTQNDIITDFLQLHLKGLSLGYHFRMQNFVFFFFFFQLRSWQLGHSHWGRQCTCK